MDQILKTLMDVQVEHRETVRLSGRCLKTTFENGRQAKEIPPFFHKTMLSGDLSSIPGRKGSDQYCVIQLKQDSQEFDYHIAVEVEADSVLPEGMVSLEIPPQDYAVLSFIKRGNADVLAAFQYVEKYGLHKSGYQPSGGTSFIYYQQPFFDVYSRFGYEGNPVASVYLAIKKA